MEPECQTGGQPGDFAAQVARHAGSHPHERRDQRRHKVTAVVLAQPVDENWNAVGDAFEVVMTDLSTIGIGFLHPNPVEARHLYVELESESGRLGVVLELNRCQQMGCLYSIGGSFVAKLGGSPSSVED